MPIIEQINQMRQQGLNDGEISQRLQEQGVSPLEINEAFDQSNVKSAVSGFYQGDSSNQNPQQQISPQQMQPSMMQPQERDVMPIPQMHQTKNIPGQEEYYQQMQPPVNMTKEMQMPEEQMTPLMSQEGGYNYPEYEQYGSAYPQYEYSQGTDTETMTEIARQITEEELDKIKKQVQEFTKFKIETKGRISNIDERLRRIEIIIDRLQASIIGKIGEQWETISNLKNEMQATQESFSKVLTPFSENMRKLRRISDEKEGPSEKEHKKTTVKKRGRPRKKPRDRFEHYLRG